MASSSRRLATLCLLSPLCCHSGAALERTAAPASSRIEVRQERSKDEGRRFEALLWRYKGPAPSKDWAATLRDAGITGVSVDQDEDPARVHALGLRYYLDHAAGKGTLHLRQKPFEERLRAYERSRSPIDLIRPQALGSQKVRQQLLALVEARVGRAAKTDPLMISLDDEISTTRFANPLDFCFSPSSLSRFASWLKRKYGSMNRLARVWGRDRDSLPASFQGITPPTTDEVRYRELEGRDWPRRLSDWNDARAFQDALLAETLRLLRARSKKLAPSVPVGFEGGQAPSAFGGFDYARLLRAVDYIEPYDIGGARELVRSFRGANTRHFETVFPAKGKQASWLPVARLYDAFAHGLHGVVLWSAGDFFEGKNPKQLSSYGQLLARELPALTRSRTGNIAGAPIYPGAVWLLESQESVRLHWMLDSRKDGKTWTRRFSSYERTHSSSQAARVSWIRLLQDLGYAFRFVPAEEFAQQYERATLRPRAVILPSCLALSSAQSQALTGFVKKGGLLIADETPARYDENLVLRSAPALDALFGIERKAAAKRHISEGRVLSTAPVDEGGVPLAESGILPSGLTSGKRIGEDWSLLERGEGRGKLAFLNLAVLEYVRIRLDESPEAVRKARFLRALVRRLLREREIYPVAVCEVAGYPSVLERILLGKGREKILVVRANCIESRAVMRRLLRMGRRPMTLRLPVPAKVREYFTGRTLGVGDKIRCEIDPLRGAYFVLEAL